MIHIKKIRVLFEVVKRILSTASVQFLV
uniref:Uncharacterized protein n=1 Tax=Arundo donax TaxID=35708 RepID=A0A0A9EDH1_ARUDO